MQMINQIFERLWKKELSPIKELKESKIDVGDTDSLNEDEDNYDWLDKNKNRIKKTIEEFEERRNNYFKHCNKEKIKTISTWCNELLHNQSKMIKNKDILKNVKETLKPVQFDFRKLANRNYPLHKKRKILQEVQVGKGILSVIETVALPYIKLLAKTLERKR
jgi:hypothetical protein